MERPILYVYLTKEKSFKQGRIIAYIDEDAEINLEEAQTKLYRIDLEHPEKVLSMHDANDEEPDEVEEVLEVVTATKLINEVVTTTGPTTTAEATKVSVPRRSNVMKYQALKRKPLTKAQAMKNMMLYLRNMAGFKMSYFKGMTYSEIRPLFEKHYNYNQDFLEEVNEEVTLPEKEVKVEGHKREGERLEKEITKKQKIDEDAEELKSHLQEDLESLWKIVKERFKKTKPKNYSDDYLLKTLKTMFKQPDVEASVWRDQKGRYGLTKRYPLTHFTLEQMMNVSKDILRLEVDEESEMSLELLRLVRRQLNEGYVPK
nr:hypothetical protein [Tanacetum cinerariifolium]